MIKILQSDSSCWVESLYLSLSMFALGSQQPYAPPPHPMAPPSPSTNNCSQGGAEQLSKTNLYIRGLPPGTTDQDLIKLCQPWVLTTIAVKYNDLWPPGVCFLNVFIYSCTSRLYASIHCSYPLPSTLLLQFAIISTIIYLIWKYFTLISPAVAKFQYILNGFGFLGGINSPS